MDTEQLWASFWAVLGATIIGLSLVIHSYSTQENEIILQMVKEGYSPIEAACAVEDSMGDSPTCVAFAIKNGE